LTERFGAIVVGGGHNGLVCAAYLARAGKRVCVLERREVLGGACVTEEVCRGTGALDARLRKDLQVELKTLQSEIGVTFVFVTHDQEEALTMSDRIAVMSEGRVEQAGSPQAVYEAPATLFVADFLGVSNRISAEATGGDGSGCTLRIGERMLRADQGATGVRGEVKAMVRPERVGVEPHGSDGPNRVPAMLEHVVFLGSFRELHLRIVGGALVKAIAPNDGVQLQYEQGTPVTLHLPAEAIRVLATSRS
jgi:spermidine/putrescine transport system ATP-binding protein